MSEWLTHQTIYRVLEFELTYKTRSPLRIGASKGKSFFSPIDLQVMRIMLNGKEVPYIAGSSIKGVFRSTAEMLLRSYGKRACNMGQCANETTTNNITRDERLQDAIKEYYRGNTNAKEIINILNEYCLICKIFGSNTYSAHIIFSDAYPTDNVSIGVKTGIAINRRSGAVKGGALYQVEFVNPNSIFHGSIRLINLPNYAIGLILKIIKDMVNNGITRFGGFKSRGFGHVNINIDKIKGFVVEGGKLMDIKEVKELKPIDEYDKSIERTENIEELIVSFIKVWDEYVSKDRS